MIFQDPRAHINPVRRIGDFLTEGLRTNRRRSQATRRTQRGRTMLEQVGIDHGDQRLRQYPHELSGGMLQRVMIATALLTEPRLLLADEPTTALDVTTQAEVMAILDELRRERGLAMLFITHDLELAAAVCDRTCRMYAGRIVEEPRRRRCSTRPAAPVHRGAGRGAAGHRPDARTAWSRSRVVRCRPSRHRRRCAFADALPARRGTQCRTSEPDARRARRRRRRAASAPTSCAASWEASGSWLRPGAVLEVSGLRKEFGDRGRGRRRVVRRSPPARSLAIVGESGSGKTTDRADDRRARAPTAGTIIAVRRRPVASGRAARTARRRGREVQIVFQDPYTSLDPRQSAAARSTRCCGCTSRRPPSDDGSASRELVELVGLDDTAGQRAAPRAVRRPAAARRHRPRARGRAAGC